jgi:hypothetical protein
MYILFGGLVSSEDTVGFGYTTKWSFTIPESHSRTFPNGNPMTKSMAGSLGNMQLLLSTKVVFPCIFKANILRGAVLLFLSFLFFFS